MTIIQGESARISLGGGGATPAGGETSLWDRFRRHRPQFLYLALFYAAYVLAGGFGQGLAIIPGVAVTFWPPAGIFVATLLLTSKYSWPWWILAGCLAELTCNAIWFHNAIPFALIYFAANALVAVTAAGLIDRFVGKPLRLETLEEVAAFVVLGAGIAPMISATIIATTDVLLGKHPFWTAWPLVWFGDGTGLLVSTPLTLVAVRAWRERAAIPPPRLIEAAIVLGLLLGIGALSFKGYLPTPYMLLPPLLWAAARFQLKGAAAALALVAVTEALFVVSGEGALAGPAELVKEKIVGLQAFLGIAAISSLVVAVLSLQHKQALQSLKEANADLETRVLERTASLRESEAALAARAEELQTFFEISPVGISLAREPECQNVWINPALRSLLRLEESANASASSPNADMLPYRVFRDGAPLEANDMPMQQACASGMPVLDQELEIVFRDGTRRTLLKSAQPLLNGEGKVRGCLAFNIDITERKKAEQAVAEAAASLARERERLNIALKTGELGVYEWRVGESSVWWSPETYRLFGADPATFVPTVDSFGALIHPGDREEIWRKTNEAIARREVFIHEYRIIRPDGELRWLANRSHVGLDAAGEVERLTGVVADITERRHAEKALQASEAFSRSVLEASPDCVKVIGPDGKLEFMNSHGLQQMEIDDFAFCRGEPWSALWPERTRQTVADSIAAAMNGVESRFEAFCPTAKGTPKWWDVAVSPVVDAQQRCTRIVSISRDITERKRHEDHLKLMMHELNHRVKNTLATIQSMASQTLRTSPDLAEAKERFEARLMALSKTHDVLTREKWEGALLPEIVDRAIAPYRGTERGRFAIKGPAIRVPPRFALAIAMALHELCTNAVKYGALANDKGKVSFTWSVSDDDDAPRLKMRWSEKGGPPVTPPTRKGFGSRLIERGLASDLGGEVSLKFAKTGVACTIVAPLDKSGGNFISADRRKRSNQPRPCGRIGSS